MDETVWWVLVFTVAMVPIAVPVAWLATRLQRLVEPVGSGTSALEAEVLAPIEVAVLEGEARALRESSHGRWVRR